MRFGFVNLKKYAIAAVTSLIVIGVATPFAINALSNPSEPAEEYVDNQTAMLPKPTDGSKPNDHSILENIQIAAGVLHDNPHFKGISTGHAITNMVIQNDQNVYTERRVDGDFAMVNTITASSFVKSATQKYFPSYTAEKIFLREGKLNEEDYANSYFPDDKAPVAYARADFLNLYGWTPYQLASYIFAEDSIDFDASKVIPSSEFAYVAEVHLDLENSIAQTKREVKTNGGALSYPNYSELTVTVCLNDDWQVQRMMYHDVYEITVKMGVSLTAPVDSNITENFYYEDYEIDKSIKDYYAKYADLDTNNGGQEKEKTAMDYISESMLGMALAGSTLDTKVLVDDYAIEGKIYCKFDIKTTNLKLLALFNDFYINYDKQLFISYRKYNYKLDEDYFNHLIEVLNIDIDNLMSSFGGGGESSAPSNEENGLMSQLSNLQLRKENSKVYVTGALDYSGIKLDFVLNMSEDEDGAILDSIEVKCLYEDKTIKATIKVTNDKIVFDKVDYVDLSSSSWVIDSIYNIVSYEGYQNDLHYEYKEYKVDVNAILDKNKNARVITKIKSQGKEDVSFELTYFEENAYFVFGNTYLSVTKDDADALTNIIANYLSSSSLDNEKIEIKLEDIQKILDTSYEVFDGISVEKDGTINISLALSKLYDGLEDTVLKMYQQDDVLCFDSTSYSLEMRLKEYKDKLEINKKNYLGKEESLVVLNYYQDVFKTVHKGEYQVSINNLSFKQNDLDISLDGNIIRNKDNVYALLNVRYENTYQIEFYYEENEGYYIGIDGHQTSIHLFATEEELLKLIDELKNQYYELSGSYDINQMINDFINNEKDKIDGSISDNKMDLDNILELIYDVLVFMQNSSLEIKDGNVIAHSQNNINSIALTRENNAILLELDNISYEEYRVDGKIALLNQKGNFNIDKSKYVDITSVIKAIDNVTYELNKNNLTVVDILSRVDRISKYDGYEVKLTSSYQDYKLSFEFYLDSNKAIFGRLIALDKDNNQIRVDITYDNEIMYFVYGNIAFEATKENINEIASLIKMSIEANKKEEVGVTGDTLINGTSFNLKDILNITFDVYKGIEITENDVNISLALSSLNKDIKDITLRLYEVNNDIYMSSSEYNILLSLKEFKDTINIDDTLSYLSTKEVNDSYELLISLVETINNETLNIDVSTIITLGNDVYNADIKYIQNESGYSLVLKLTGSIETELRLVLKDNKYYLITGYEGSSIELVGSRVLVNKLINDTYNNRYKLVENETINELYSKYLKGIIDNENETSLDDIIPYVFDIFYNLQNAKVTVNNDVIKFEYENNNVIINKDDADYRINGNVQYEDKEFSIEMTLNNNSNDVIIESKDYFNIDIIIDQIDKDLIAFAESSYTIEDLIEVIKLLKDYSSYLVEVDYIYGQYNVKLNVQLSKNLDSIHMNVLVTKDKQKLDLTLIYQDDKVYASFGYIDLLLTNDDLVDLYKFINEYIEMNDLPNNNLDANEYELKSIITKVFEVYNGIEFLPNGNVNFKLLLSKLNYQDTTLTLGLNENNELFMFTDEPDIYVLIKDINSIQEADLSKTYLTRSEFDEIRESIKDLAQIIYNKDELVIELENINFVQDEVNGLINGKIISSKGKYLLDLDISGTYEGKIKLVYINEVYYLDLCYEDYNAKLRLSRSELDKLVDTLITNKDALFEGLEMEGFLDTYLRPIIENLTKPVELDETLDTVFDILIEVQNNGHLVVKNDGFDIIYKNDKIEYNANGEASLVFDSTSFDEVNLKGKLVAYNEINNIEVEGDYYSLDLLINKLSIVINEIANADISINDLYEDFNHVSSYSGYKIEGTYNYDDYHVVLSTFITKTLRIEAIVHIEYPGKEDLDIVVKYINDNIYLEYSNILLKVSKKDINDVKNLLDEYIDITSGDNDPKITEIIDRALNTLSSFKIDENKHIIIGLALSNLLDTRDITLDYVYDKTIDKMILVVNDYHLELVLSEEYHNILVGDKEYLSRNSLEEVIDILKEGKDIIESKKYEVLLENIKVTLDNKEYNINGKFIQNENDYELDLSIDIEENTYIINTRRINNKYYMDIELFGKEFNITLSEQQIVDLFIDIYEGRSGLLKEDNLNKLEEEYISKFDEYYDSFKNNDLSVLQKDTDILETLDTVYNVMEYILDVEFTIKNHVITYKDLNNVVTLSKDTNIKLTLDIEENDVKTSGSITLIDKETEIKNKEVTYVNVDSLIGKLDEVILSLKDSSLTIEDLIDEAKDIIGFEGYKLTFDFEYEDYVINLDVRIDSKNSVYSKVKINDELIINVYYYNEKVYFTYGNIKIKVNKEDILDGISLVSEYISLSNEEYTNDDIQNIIDKVIDVIDELKFVDNGDFVIGLSLSQISSVDDVTLLISYDKINHTITLDGSSYNIHVLLQEYNGEIYPPIGEFLTRNELEEVIDILKEGKDIIESKKYEVLLENIKVTLDNKEYNINGKFIQNENDYELDLSIDIEENTYIINTRRINNKYYMDIELFGKEFNITLSEQQIVDLFIDIYEGRSGLLKEDNLNKLEEEYISKFDEYYDSFKNNDLSVLQKDTDILETLDTVYNVMEYILDVEFTIKNHVITYKDLNNVVTLSKDTNIKLTLDIEENDVKTSGSITLIDKETEIKNKEVTYVNVDSLIGKLDEVILSLKDSSLTIEDLIDEAKDIIGFEGYKLTFDFEYEDYVINLDVRIDSKNSVYSKVKINDELIINVYYYNEKVYFTYGNIKIKVNKEDILDGISLVSEYISLSNEEYTNDDIQNIIDKVIDVIDELKFVDNGDFVIGLSLSQISSVDDVTLLISYDKINHTITLDGSSYNIHVLLQEYNGEIYPPIGEFLTRNELEEVIDILKEGKDIIESKKYEVLLENIKVTLDNKEYNINGKFIQNENDYELDLSIDIEENTYIINTRRINNKYYMDIELFGKEFNITLSEQQIVDLFIDIYEGRSGLLKEDNLNKLEEEYISKFDEYYDSFKNNDLSVLQKDTDILETLDTVYNVMEYILDVEFTIKNHVITYKDLNNVVTLSKDTNIKLTLDIEENDVKTSGSITLIDKETEIKNKEVTYVNVDSLIGKLDEVILSLKDSSLTIEDLIDEAKLVYDYEKYAIDINFVYNMDYLVAIELDLDKDLNAKGKVQISHESEDIILEVYYVNETLYIIYGNINLKLEKEDSKDALKLLYKYISNNDFDLGNENENEEYQKIVDTVIDCLYSFDIDENNHLIIGLALQNAFKGLSYVEVEAKWNSISGDMTILIPKYDGRVDIYESSDNIIAPTRTFLSRSDLDALLDMVDGITSLTLEEQQFTLVINKLEVEFKDASIEVAGTYKQNKSDYALALIINYEKEYNLNIVKKDSVYYINISIDGGETVSLKGDEKSFNSLVNTLLNNQDEILGDMSFEDYYNKYLVDYFGERKSYTFDELISLGFKALVTIKEGTLVSSNKDIILTHEKLNIELKGSENNYLVLLNTNDLEGLTSNVELEISKENNVISIIENEYYPLDNTIINLNDALLTLVESGWNIDDIIKFTKEIVEYSGYKVEINHLSMAGFLVQGTIIIDEDFNASLDLKVKYDEDEVSFKLYYYEKDFYLDWEHYKVYLDHESVVDVIDRIMDFVGMEKMSLSDIYEIIDKVNSVYVNTTSAKGDSVTLTLALSKFFNELDDTTFIFKYDDKLEITSKEGSVDIVISNFENKANKPSFTTSEAYTKEDFDVLMDYANGFKDYFVDGELSIAFDDKDHPLTISLGEDKDLEMSGSLNLKMIKVEDGDDLVTFSMKAYLTGFLHYYVALEYTKDEELYITFSTNWNENGDLVSKTSIMITRDQIIELLKEILMGIDENSEIGKRLSASDINNINMVKDILVKTGVLDKSQITTGKVEMSLKDIVPIVYKILDFIKDATISPNREDRSILISKDYIIEVDDDIIETSTTIRLYEENKGKDVSTNYIIAIENLNANDIKIKGNVIIRRYEEEVYVDKNNTIRLSKIEDLAVALFNSIEEMNFNIKGDLKVVLLGLYTLDVKVDSRIAYVGDEIEGYIYLDIPCVAIATVPVGTTANYIHSTIIFKDGYVFMKKDYQYVKYVFPWFKDVDEYYYRKNTSKGFMDNIMDNIIFIFNLQETIVNAMTKSDNNFKVVEDKLLKSYEYKDDSFNFTLDLPNGLSTGMFSELKLGIKIGSYQDRLYLKSFNGETTMFLVMKANFNFTEYGCYGNPPDMSVIPSDISSDAKYQLYNEEE